MGDAAGGKGDGCMVALVVMATVVAMTPGNTDGVAVG